ncbi:unnamed protein product [Clonostachys byssicola]|uniref:Oxysterol-binding protein n=1 Tax=Clonostachys byssicola TaxID=160290 RepID=A0A9N9Y4F5_9HYPO|nr:unnamed protein product [Clonostachys byssicola]
MTTQQMVLTRSEAKESPMRITELVKVLSTLKGDLANITAPPSFLAPSSVVENPRCWAERPAVFAAPALESSPQKRSLLVLRMFLIGLRNQYYIAGGPNVSIKKPLNAFLGELFFAKYTDKSGIASTEVAAEQVSHHPPITAIHVASREHGIRAEGYSRVEMTFSGSLNVRQTGHAVLHIDKYDEDHLLPLPTAQVRGFLSTCLYPELWGTYKIVSSSGYISEITFSGAGFLRGKKNYFEARVFHKDDGREKPLYVASGSWSKGWVVKDGQTGKKIEEYDVEAEENDPESLQIADVKDQDPWESRRAWNDVIQGVRENDWARVSRAKHIVEEGQRQMRRDEKTNGVSWQPFLFESIPGEEHSVFHRLTEGMNWYLSASETKGVWRLKDGALDGLQTPFRGALTPLG